MLRALFCAAALVWLFPGSIVAQSSPPADLAARIDAYVEPFVAAGHLSGTLLVAHGNDVLVEKSWGMADRENGREFEPNTACCVASVSKPLTVILAAQLIDQGRFQLRDPISKWLDDFPKGEQIQIRHLLYHQSGIPHRLTMPDEETISRTASDMIDLARQAEFDFEPGSRRSYSSGGFSVLAGVMELASGQSYEQMLEQTLIEPLELAHTMHPGSGVELSNTALSYTWTVDGMKRAPAKDYSFLVGAGSLFSTPGDLFLVARGLVQDRFPAMAKRQLLRGGKLQWNGITNSYRAFLEYDAESDLMVVMVSNQMAGANDLIRQNIPRIFAGETLDPPVVPQPDVIPMTTEQLSAYAGRYDIAGSEMPVTARDGALYANDWVLLPIGQREFFSPQDYGTVRIVGDGEIPEALDWSGMQCPRVGPLDQ